MPENASRATVPETVRSAPSPTVARALAAVKYDAPLPSAPSRIHAPRLPAHRTRLPLPVPGLAGDRPTFPPPPRPGSTVPLPLGGYPRPCRLAAFPPPSSCLRCFVPAVLSPPSHLFVFRPRRSSLTAVPSRHLSRPFAVCLFAPPSLSPLRFFHRKDREEPTFSAPPRVAPSVTVTKSGGFRRAAATGGGVPSTHFSPAVRYRMHKSPEHETRGRGG